MKTIKELLLFLWVSLIATFYFVFLVLSGAGIGVYTCAKDFIKKDLPDN
jgi:cytochrome bd-type quinol oxidase subunit 2